MCWVGILAGVLLSNLILYPVLSQSTGVSPAGESAKWLWIVNLAEKLIWIIPCSSIESLNRQRFFCSFHHFFCMRIANEIPDCVKLWKHKIRPVRKCWWTSCALGFISINCGGLSGVDPITSLQWITDETHLQSFESLSQEKVIITADVYYNESSPSVPNDEQLKTALVFLPIQKTRSKFCYNLPNAFNETEGSRNYLLRAMFDSEWNCIIGICHSVLSLCRLHLHHHNRATATYAADNRAGRLFIRWQILRLSRALGRQEVLNASYLNSGVASARSIYLWLWSVGKQATVELSHAGWSFGLRRNTWHWVASSQVHMRIRIEEEWSEASFTSSCRPECEVHGDHWRFASFCTQISRRPFRSYMVIPTNSRRSGFWGLQPYRRCNWGWRGQSSLPFCSYEIDMERKKLIIHHQLWGWCEER